LGECRQKLLPYQRQWLTDTHRFRIANKARQVGWSTVIGLEALIQATYRRRQQIIVSASEKNAQEVLGYARGWLELANFCGCEIQTDIDSQTELSIAGGQKILSLPQNPRTIRGFAGDVYLDEYAHHRDAREIYTAVFPSTTRGYRLSVVSTPLGESGEYHKLWSGSNDYSRHRITIHDAIRDGLAVDVEAIRRNMDAESFRQEYECEFIDESTSYFPYELLVSCTGPFPADRSGSHYLGVDVGRRHDRTAISVVQQLGNVYYAYPVEVMARTEFAIQQTAIEQIWTERKIQRGAIDESGIGMQLAEDLRRELGNIEPVTFTNLIKESLVVTVRRLLEARRLVLPEDDQGLIADMHSIKKEITIAGNVRYDAERSESGHADRFWALALAVHASGALQYQMTEDDFRSVEMPEMEAITVTEGY